LEKERKFRRKGEFPHGLTSLKGVLRACGPGRGCVNGPYCRGEGGKKGEMREGGEGAVRFADGGRRMRCWGNPRKM